MPARPRLSGPRKRKEFYMRVILGLVFACSWLITASGQSVPRLPDGKPDLSGVWDHPRVTDIGTNAEGKCAGETPGCKSTGFGEWPFTPYGAAEFKKEKFDYGVHCLPWGYVRSWATP